MSQSHASSLATHRWVTAGIGITLVAYLVLLAMGCPQQWSKAVNSHHEGSEAHAVSEAQTAEHSSAAPAGHSQPDHGGGSTGHAGPQIIPPPMFMILPFALLLGAIAVLPLLPWTEHWWESNLHRFYVAGGLGVLTLLYYLVWHEWAIEAHWPGHAVVPAVEGLNFGLAWAVLANAILYEYIPFIVLLFSLYTISGGIRIEGDLRAHPLTNTLFIAAGGVLASFVGTTGAAMLLIRPLLETNRERKHVVHTVIFFIFVVCNCGGCLLPIGDPPLFLGYLRGVPFLWTFRLWVQWLFVNGALLALYYIWDRFWAYPHEELRDLVRDETQASRLKFVGLVPNVFLLLGVVLSVALLDPTKAVPGTNWHPWYYLREIAQIGLVALSLVWSDFAVRKANNFNYHAILEVAALFSGIFVCMQAPLQILNVKGPSLGLVSPRHFFWATGSLSSVLDNAPTYVVFFETAKALTTAKGLVPVVAGVAESLLIGVSLGAVFMGAMTYIGNGPNFMVKAIAEKSGIRMPSFFGYMAYSCAILLPVFLLTTWIFL